DLRSGDDAEAFQVRRERCPLRCTGRAHHSMIVAGKVEKCTSRGQSLLPGNPGQGQNLIPRRPKMGVRWPMAGKDSPVPGRGAADLGWEKKLHRHLAMLES